PGQVRPQPGVAFPPLVPSPRALSEQGEVFFVRHVVLSRRRGTPARPATFCPTWPWAVQHTGDGELCEPFPLSIETHEISALTGVEARPKLRERLLCVEGQGMLRPFESLLSRATRHEVPPC